MKRMRQKNARGGKPKAPISRNYQKVRSIITQGLQNRDKLHDRNHKEVDSAQILSDIQTKVFRKYGNTNAVVFQKIYSQFSNTRRITPAQFKVAIDVSYLELGRRVALFENWL